MSTETAHPRRRKGGPKDIPATIGATPKANDAAGQARQPSAAALRADYEAKNRLAELATVRRRDGRPEHEVEGAASSANPSTHMTTDQRVKAIKAHVQKGEQHAGKSEQHFISAGKHLEVLKS